MKRALLALAQAAIVAALVGFPFAIHFWNMKP